MGASAYCAQAAVLVFVRVGSFTIVAAFECRNQAVDNGRLFVCARGERWRRRRRRVG